MSKPRGIPYSSTCECGNNIHITFPVKDEFMHDTNKFVRCSECDHITKVDKHE